jgi:hypothetical protein
MDSVLDIFYENIGLKKQFNLSPLCYNDVNVILSMLVNSNISTFNAKENTTKKAIKYIDDIFYDLPKDIPETTLVRRCYLKIKSDINRIIGMKSMEGFIIIKNKLCRVILSEFGIIVLSDIMNIFCEYILLSSIEEFLFENKRMCIDFARESAIALNIKENRQIMLILCIGRYNNNKKKITYETSLGIRINNGKSCETIIKNIDPSDNHTFSLINYDALL